MFKHCKMALSIKLIFNKDRIKISGEARVYLRITIDRSSKLLNMDFFWPADKIDSINCCLKPRHADDQDVHRRNLQIKNKISDITDIETTYSLKRKRLSIDQLLRETGFYKKRILLTDYMTKKLKERFEGGEIEKGTRDNGLSVVKLLNDYKKTIYLDEVDSAWLTKYAAWLRKAGNEPGTVWNKIKNIKGYLKLASKEVMLVVNPDYENYKNTVPETETVFLNQRELNLLIAKCDCPALTSTQRRVLLAFLFQCTTSLRISDVYKANSDWQLENNMLKFIPHKGRKKRVKKLVVPIMPGAMTFIENLKGNFFQLPTEQEYNRTLKELAEMVGIYKNVTSHVGRHTYGYLFTKYIGNIKALQRILGHSSSSTTQRYSHLEDDDLFDFVIEMQNKMDESIQIPAVVKKLWPVPESKEGQY